MADETAARVGDTVRAEMARNRVTQEDLARRLNLSQAAVSRRLNGDIPFNVSELATVGRAVGVPLNRLVAGADRPARQPEAVAS